MPIFHVFMRFYRFLSIFHFCEWFYRLLSIFYVKNDVSVRFYRYMSIFHVCDRFLSIYHVTREFSEFFFCLFYVFVRFAVFCVYFSRFRIILSIFVDLSCFRTIYRFSFISHVFWCFDEFCLCFRFTESYTDFYRFFFVLCFVTFMPGCITTGFKLKPFLNFYRILAYKLF